MPRDTVAEERSQPVRGAEALPKFELLSIVAIPTNVQNHMKTVRIELERDGKLNGLLFSNLVPFEKFRRESREGRLEDEQKNRDFYERWLEQMREFYERRYSFLQEIKQQKHEALDEIDDVNDAINYEERNGKRKSVLDPLREYRDRLRDYVTNLAQTATTAAATHTWQGLQETVLNYENMKKAFAVVRNTALMVVRGIGPVSDAIGKAFTNILSRVL